MDITTLAAAKSYTDKKISESGGSSLVAGDLLEIKDGVIRSTLGDSHVQTSLVTKFDSGRLVLEDSQINEEDVEDGKVWAEYYYTVVTQPTFLDKPENEDEMIELEVKYYPPNSNEFVVLKSLMSYSLYTKEEPYIHKYEVYVNAKLGEDDLEIDNANYPGITISAEMPYWDGDKEEYVYDIFGIFVQINGYGAQDISGARLVIEQEDTIETVITLPNKALTFDEEPTEGSENLVASSTIYESFQNVNKNIQSLNNTFATKSDLNNKQDKLIFDSTPTANSTNPVTSGGVYESLQNINVEEIAQKTVNETVPTIVEETSFSKISVDNLEANSIIVPSGEIITEIATATSNAILGNNLLSLGKEYLVVYNDVEYRLTCENTSGELRLGDSAEFGFYVYQDYQNITSFVPTSAPCTFSLSKIEISKVDLVDYVVGLDEVVEETVQEIAPNVVEDVLETKLDEKLPEVVEDYIGHGNLIGKTGSTEDSYGRTIQGAEIFNNYEANVASNDYAHAEGDGTTASGGAAHAEGVSTTANGIACHAEGWYTTATGGSGVGCAHAEGAHTTANGSYSHAEGVSTTANGYAAHAEGYNTEAYSDYSHVQGKYNILDTENKYAHIVGNGENSQSRSNAHTLDWDGNAWYAGTIEGKGIVLPSTTEGSTKRFLITVDDSGTLTVTEIVETVE